MKKKFLILIAVLIVGGLVLSACGNGSTPSLKGKVYYNNTDSMVYNAEVLLDGQVRDKTDYYGEFYITGLNEDSYTLRIRKKDAIEDYVATVYPSVNKDLGIIRVEPVADTTIINGQVNVSNLTQYDDSQVSGSSNVKSVSNFNQTNKEKFKQDEIIVKYSNSTITSASNSVKQVQGLNIAKKMNRGNGELVKFKIPAGKTVDEMIEYFSQQPGVEYAEPNYYVYAQAIPNDPRYQDSNGDIIQWGSIAVNLEAAWDEQKYSDSVTVAILDSGIIPDHPDLEANITGGGNLVGDSGGNTDPINYTADTDIKDRTPESNGGSHGTHVAGIIGAVTNNNRGVAGVSWRTNLMPVKVLEGRTGELFDVLEGIYYSIDQKVDIINLSLGIPTDEISSDDISSFREAIQEAASENIIIVASAGNTSSIQYPAIYRETIAVGAVDINNQITSYSPVDSRIDLVAPGGDGNGILSTWGYYDNGSYVRDYDYMTGTSMAAAYVSGAAALLLEKGVSPRNIRDRLTSTAVDLGDTGKDPEYGYGLLDAYGALLNKKIGAPYVFAATKSNGTLIIESNSTRMNSDGSYTLSDRIIGDYYMVAWRDINNNFEIDGGDYYGITDKESFFEPGNVYNDGDPDTDTNINMYYVTSSSTAASLSVEGIEKLRD